MKLLQGTTEEKIQGTIWNHAEVVFLFNVSQPEEIS